MPEDTPSPVPPAPAAPAAVPAPGAAPAADKPPVPGGGDRAVSQSVWLSLEGGGEAAAPKVVKSKGSKNITSGILHVTATFNNTMVSITDKGGNVIGWSSAGKMGFKGSRKGTAYAAQVVSQDACRQAMSHGLKEVEARLKGPGSGRESAVRAVQALGIEITVIKDVTPVPHNGCRPPKARRV
jgi:small subunit ribosomal protein S11